jgi:hypothetical protein
MGEKDISATIVLIQKAVVVVMGLVEVMVVLVEVVGAVVEAVVEDVSLLVPMWLPQIEEASSITLTGEQLKM